MAWIRLARFGCRPYSRVMATNGLYPLDGKHLELLGYNPFAGDSGNKLVLNLERLRNWMLFGARPTGPLHCVVVRAGLLDSSSPSSLPSTSHGCPRDEFSTCSLSYELGPLSHNSRGLHNCVFSRKSNSKLGPKPFECQSKFYSQDEVPTGKKKALRQGVHNMLSRKLSSVPSQVEDSVSQLLDSKPNFSAQTELTDECKVVPGNKELLLQKIDDALSESKRRLDKTFLKHRFEAEFRPLLSSACLLLPEGLRSKSTELLHTHQHKIMRRTPQYLSSFEFMLQRERVDDDDEWNQFWNQIVSSRVFIVEDWDTNIGNVETFHYDYGIKGFFKGEVDASFHDGKNGEPGEATISVVIWRDKEVIWSEVYMDMQCTSIHVAEAYAVLALFFKCFELKIEELVLWTDNSDIHGSVTGSYTVSQGRDKEERHLLLLLGCMMKRFKNLVPMLKPRELMFLADDLAKGDALDLVNALKKFDYQLRQKALFRLSLAGPAKLIVKNFSMEKLKKRPYIRKHQTTFFLLVDNLDKVDAISQIRDTLCPSELYLAIDCFDQKPDDFQSRVKECFGSKLHQGILKDGCTVLHHATKFDGGKRLLVVVDSSLPKERYDFLGCFTIILVSWVERKALDPSIEELSALSYRYFCGDA